MIISITVATLLAIVTILLVGGIPTEGRIITEVYHSPVLIALFAITIILIVIASIVFTIKFNKHKKKGIFYCFSFYLMHYGVAMALIGSAITYFKAQKVTFIASLTSSRMINELPPNLTRKPKTFKLPFYLRAKNFDIKYYPPKFYTFWSYNDKKAKFEEFSDEKHPDGKYYIKNIKNKKVLNFGNFKNIPIQRLKIKDNWKRRIYLDEENVLEINTLKPKKFSCEISFAPSKIVNDFGYVRKENSDKLITKKTIINHPASYNGWRIFLMSYDRRNAYQEDGIIRYVYLTARKDPGRIPVHIGIWAIIVGTFMWAFAPKKSKHHDAEEIAG